MKKAFVSVLMILPLDILMNIINNQTINAYKVQETVINAYKVISPTTGF